MNLQIAAAGAVLAVLAGTHWKAYHSGAESVRVEWQADKQAAELQAENNRLLAQASINKSANTFAKQAAKSRGATQSNIAKVDDYAPVSHPPLPSSFRVWHDAAATGEAINDSSGIDAATVSLKQTAVTVANNYADAHYDKQRLESLQAIVRASGCFELAE